MLENNKTTSYSNSKSQNFSANKVYNTKYMKKPIKTHFITERDDHLDLIKTYVLPHYKKGDILAISEKIIALCQNMVVYREEIKVGRLAKFLARFVNISEAGLGIGNPEKMQVVIQKAGTFRVLIGAFAAAVTRMLGIKGVFYRIVQNDSQGIDGFTNSAFEYYKDKAILSPKNPEQVCEEIKKYFGVNTLIVDANDLNVEILGVNRDINLTPEAIKKILADNPAGQKNEQTPFVLLRPFYTK